ncbi:MAG: amino acid ABC transporter permease [Eubacterium sp.]|jgi:polar amino acid transport system permease protein
MSFATICLELLKGLGSSTLIFALTLIFSLPLGLLVCFGRMSRFAPLKGIMVAFIAVLRGTPLMLQLLVVCYGPFYLFGLRISSQWRFLAIIIGFVINYAAYFAEIYRAGITSIPVGQREAAEVLGYNRRQTFFRIILPQMVKRVLPPVTNEVITLIKDTSLAFVLAYAEMFTVAKQIAAAETSFVPLFVAGLFYFIFNAVVAWAMARIEKKFSYFE